ncbi:MAG: SixA phosphatase family protein [Spirochaetia bacterium]
MKYLILMRHGKAVDSDKSPDDFSRDLHPRGISEVRDTAVKLHGKEYLPDIIITSTAQRAVQTAELVADIIHIPEFIRVDELYQAGVETVLALIREHKEQENSLMIVGHNPTMEDTAAQLLKRDISMKTSQILVIEIVIEKWDDISDGPDARLIERFAP